MFAYMSGESAAKLMGSPDVYLAGCAFVGLGHDSTYRNLDPQRLKPHIC